MIVAVFLLASLVVACNKKPVQPAVTAKPPLPPPVAVVSDFDLAEGSFDNGNYREAIQSFETYLKTNPPSKRDRALFKLGLAYALVGQTVSDREQSRLYFQRLASEFPGTPLSTEALLILSLQDEVDRLGGILEEQKAEIAKLNDSLSDQQTEAGKLKAGKREQQVEIEKYRGELKETQARIKELSDELERLKAIDMQRRPSRPPK